MPLPTLPEREFTGSDGQKSQGTAGPESIKKDTDSIINFLSFLLSTIEGESGASLVKSATIAGINGDNVYDIIANLKTYLDQQDTDIRSSIAQVVLGQIPEESLTLDKFSKDVLNLIMTMS